MLVFCLQDDTDAGLVASICTVIPVTVTDFCVVLPVISTTIYPLTPGDNPHILLPYPRVNYTLIMPGRHVVK